MTKVVSQALYKKQCIDKEKKKKKISVKTILKDLKVKRSADVLQKIVPYPRRSDRK